MCLVFAALLGEENLPAVSAVPVVCIIHGRIIEWYWAYSKQLDKEVRICARCTPEPR